METVQKNDFIEIDFTGKAKDGDVFDTTNKQEAEKAGLQIKDPKPLIICVGQEMVIPGLDKAFEGKELNKQYSVEIEPKDAFKERKRDLVKLLPKKAFIDNKINPMPGMTLALDSTLVKIVSVSGGRVLVDFNNPLAGKTIIYEFTIKKILSDDKEKVNTIIDFFLKGQKLDFEIKDKKVIFKAQSFYKPLIEELNKRFKDILGLEMVLEEKKEEKAEEPEKKEEGEKTSSDAEVKTEEKEEEKTETQESPSSA